MSIVYGSLSRDVSPAGYGINQPALDSNQLMFSIGGELSGLNDMIGDFGTLEISSDGTSNDEKAVQTSGPQKKAKATEKSVGKPSNPVVKAEKNSSGSQGTNNKKPPGSKGAEKGLSKKAADKQAIR
jgi:hypothetical protein